MVCPSYICPEWTVIEVHRWFKGALTKNPLWWMNILREDDDQGGRRRVFIVVYACGGWMAVKSQREAECVQH